MLTFIATKTFEESYHRLPQSIRKKLDKQGAIFCENPFHPSLHTEKLRPKQKEYWSFRIDKQYRVLFRFGEQNTVYLITSGTHDWVYRFPMN